MAEGLSRTGEREKNHRRIEVKSLSENGKLSIENKSNSSHTSGFAWSDLYLIYITVCPRETFY